MEISAGLVGSARLIGSRRHRLSMCDRRSCPLSHVDAWTMTLPSQSGVRRPLASETAFLVHSRNKRRCCLPSRHESAQPPHIAILHTDLECRPIARDVAEAARASQRSEQGPCGSQVPQPAVRSAAPGGDVRHRAATVSAAPFTRDDVFDLTSELETNVSRVTMAASELSALAVGSWWPSCTC